MTNQSSHRRFVRRACSALLTAAALAFLGPNLEAEVVTNDIVPFNSIVTSSCLGEPVQLTGDLHVVMSVQETGNGIRISTHNHPVGVTGTGLITGSAYQAVGITRADQFVDGPPPQDITLVNNFYIIGKGRASNFLVHITRHVTVNAGGTITANAVNASMTCH